MVSVTLFKIKDNGHDYKYKSLEGARFLPRNNLFLPFRHQFVMVKEGKMARVQEVMKKGLNSQQKTGPAAVLQRARGGTLGHTGKACID